MEFFNYRYCILLNNNNENYKINQLINNVNKEIKIYTNRINNSANIYMKNHCLIKYKLVSIRHTIIKLLIILYNTKKEIKQTNIDLALLNNEIYQSSQIINIIKYINTSNYKVNIISKNYTQYENILNNIIYIIRTYIFISTFNITHNDDKILYISYINNIFLNLEKNIYKKHKKLFNIICKSLMLYINNYCQLYITENLNSIEYIIELLLLKLLQFNNTVLLNNNLLIFFKHRAIICKKNNKLNNSSKKIICTNDKNKNKIIKIQSSIENFINKYMSLCNVITKKKIKIDIIIIKYETMINKLNVLLHDFKNKLLKLENDSSNNIIECPPELKKKCIKFDTEDNNICCICLDPILLGVKTSCNHIFHIHCINLFIYSIISNSISEIKILCPLCRNYI